jgi:hypothetical protein
VLELATSPQNVGHTTHCLIQNQSHKDASQTTPLGKPSGNLQRTNALFHGKDEDDGCCSVGCCAVEKKTTRCRANQIGDLQPVLDETTSPWPRKANDRLHGLLTFTKRPHEWCLSSMHRPDTYPPGIDLIGKPRHKGSAVVENCTFTATWPGLACILIRIPNGERIPTPSPMLKTQYSVTDIIFGLFTSLGLRRTRLVRFRSRLAAK